MRARQKMLAVAVAAACPVAGLPLTSRDQTALMFPIILPTQAEWSATITRAVALGCTLGNAPSLTNDAGIACLSAGPSSFAGVASDNYWSSTSRESASDSER